MEWNIGVGTAWLVGNVGTPLYDPVWWDICFESVVAVVVDGGMMSRWGTFIIVLRIKYGSYVNDAETIGWLSYLNGGCW